MSEEANKRPARRKRAAQPVDRLGAVARLAVDELLPIETVARLAKKNKQWIYDHKWEMGAVNIGGKEGWRIPASGWNAFVRKLGQSSRNFIPLDGKATA